jgi:hypothetical protein
MALTVVLAVGMDSWKLATQSSAWKSQGFILVPVDSIDEAIDHFIDGDFDLVLLDNTISSECSERLTFLIRASGSFTPVVCLAATSGDYPAFTDATFRYDSYEPIPGMKELLTKKPIERVGKKPAHENVA